jgi:Cu(I)/Ag(I) efflux system membrane protein CusA/SilA
MSLGGIAIAIGAMIDAAIVMIENMHKHLERALDAQAAAAGSRLRREAGLERLSPDERWAIVVASAKEVGPASSSPC